MKASSKSQVLLMKQNQAPISRESHANTRWDHFSPRSIQPSPETFKGTFNSRNLSASGTQVGVLSGRGDVREDKVERGGIMAIAGEELEVAASSAEFPFLWHFAFCSSPCMFPPLHFDSFDWSLMVTLPSTPVL
jgi:hypothetical protein